MKHLTCLSIITGLLLFLLGCAKDPEPQPPIVHDYQINILSPTIDFILLTDTLRLKLEVTDLKGGKIENVRFRIFNLLDSNQIYSEPKNTNIAYSGVFLFLDSLTLSELPAHTNWVLEAKAWGKNPGEFEEVKTFGFHVHDGG